MPEASELTLELLQSYYNVPLAELAKELGLSLTLLKKICRKFGIQRWPHRQIRSLNKNAQELRARAFVATSADEQADINAQLELLEKKKRLVTRGASSGLQSAMRNALFLANPEQLEEDDDVVVAPTPTVVKVKEAAPKKAKPAATPLYKMMQSMKSAQNDILVAGDMLPQERPVSSSPAPFVMPSATGFNSFTQMHQDPQVLQQQMAEHMSQMAMHQQMQMNTYMNAPAPQPAAPAAVAAPPAAGFNAASFDAMFDATPFDELADLLGMGDEADAALAGMQLPADFDDDFMMMMETCASGALEEPMALPQALPMSMHTGFGAPQTAFCMDFQGEPQQQFQYHQQQQFSPYMQMGWTV